VQEYYKKIKAKMAAVPPSAARAYDIIYSYQSCREVGRANKPAISIRSRKIRGCLAGMKNFPGVGGEITYNEDRDGAGSSAILKVIGGKYVNVAK
jgi:hypothetical protein